MLPPNSEVEEVGEVAVAVSTVPLATPGSDASGITNRNRFVVSVPTFRPLTGPGP